MRRLMPLAVAFVVCVVMPASSLAAGFSIFEAGAKALGMGGAFTAQADDPSAIFFNAAGLADVENTHVYIGSSMIFTGTDFAGVGPDPGFGVEETTGTLVFPPINVYYSREIKDNLVAGVGVFNAYGLGQSWENERNFSGRHIAYHVDLKTFYVNPTIAWRANDKLSVGAGFQGVYSSVHLQRYNVMLDPNGSGYFNVADVDLDGNSVFDIGANFGVKYTPTSDIAVGAHYRSRVTGNIEGDAKFAQVMTGTPIDDVIPDELPANQGVATEVVFPWLMSVGAAYTGVENWVFEADFNYFGWSDFEELVFTFDDPTLNVTRPQNYDNTLSIRTGAQYSYNEVIDLRGGYYFDPTPQPVESMSPFLGDSDRHGLSLGVGLHHKAMTIDMFALILLTSERSTEGMSSDQYNGTYLAFGNLFGLNLGFEF